MKYFKYLPIAAPLRIYTIVVKMIEFLDGHPAPHF